jgi:hypothetical protein
VSVRPRTLRLVTLFAILLAAAAEGGWKWDLLLQ